MAELKTRTMVCIQTSNTGSERMLIEKGTKIKGVLLTCDMMGTTDVAGSVDLSKEDKVAAHEDVRRIAYMRPRCKAGEHANCEVFCWFGGDYILSDDDEYLYLRVQALSGVTLTAIVVIYMEE